MRYFDNILKSLFGDYGHITFKIIDFKNIFTLYNTLSCKIVHFYTTGIIQRLESNFERKKSGLDLGFYCYGS